MISLQVNLRSFQEKRIVTVFGHEIILRSATKKGNKGEERVDDGDDENEAENDKERDEG